MSRRIALVVLALATIAVFATGAFGFTSVSAERGVSVAVVDDENAFLGLPNEPSVTCEVADDTETGCTVALVDVTNQFSTALTDVSANATSDELSLSSAPDEIGVGETETIHGTVPCDPDEGEETEQTYELTISVDGDGVSATKYDKAVTVTCIGVADPLDSVGVTFDGCGNAEVTGDAEDFPLEATLTFADGTTSTVTVESSGEKVRSNTTEGTQLESVSIGSQRFENDACSADADESQDSSEGQPTAEPDDGGEEDEATETQTDENAD